MVAKRTKTRKSQGRRGRPTRAEASAKALAAVAAQDVDPETILKSIAKDTSAPAAARVAACKALLRIASPEDGDAKPGGDQLSRAALAMMADDRDAGRRPN